MQSFDTSPAQIKAVDELIDGLRAVDRGLVGQMGVSGCCQQADMAEDLLELKKINSCFQQMGRVAVAKGMA